MSPWFNSPVDVIALASVISSATVATATIVINAATKRGDRKHASTLDFEKRSWDLKSAALLDVVGVCVEIRRRVPAGSTEFLTVAELRDVERVTSKLRGSVGATVTALADPKTADAIGGVLLDLPHLAEYLVSQASMAREMKEAAIETNDFETAARYRQSEQSSVESLESMSIQVSKQGILDAAKNLQDLAQKDVKGKL